MTMKLKFSISSKMTKRIFSNKAIRLTALSMVMATTGIASAHDFEAGGLYYNITAPNVYTVSLTSSPRGAESYKGHVIIPEKVVYNGMEYKVTVIESAAFEGCEDLRSIYIPSTVKKIGSFAFLRCNGLQKVEVSDIESWCSIGFETPSSNPLAKAAHLFLDGKEVVDLVVPSTVEKIKSYTFFNCSGIKSMTLPATLVSIGDNAFHGCSSLQEVTVPESVTTLGVSAFFGCTSLEAISLPTNLYSIGSYAFYNCKSLAYVQIPENVAEINYSSFKGCTSLQSVDIPSNVTKIHPLAFPGSALTSVTIPVEMEKIGGDAFADCPNLTAVISLNTVPPAIRQSTFTEATYKNATLYVPAQSRNAYMSDPCWKNFYDIREENVAAVEDLTISNIENLEVYSLDGVKVNVSSSEDLQTLQRGIYVVNGKKVIVK